MKMFFRMLVTAICFFICASSLLAQEERYLPLAAIESALMQGQYDSVKQMVSDIFDREDIGADVKLKAEYYFSLALMKEGKYLEAQGFLEKLFHSVESLSWYDQAGLALMNAYYLNGEYEKVLSVGKELLKNASDSGFVGAIQLKLARAHLKLAHWNTARGYLRQIIQKYPGSSEAYTAKQLSQEKQYFTVQVGAFKHQSGADKLIRELQAAGEYAYIVETESEDREKLYRVRVGQLGHLPEAESLRVKLSEQGYPAVVFP